MDKIKGFRLFIMEGGRSEHTISAYCRDVKELEGWSFKWEGLPAHQLAQINLTQFQ